MVSTESKRDRSSTTHTPVILGWSTYLVGYNHCYKAHPSGYVVMDPTVIRNLLIKQVEYPSTTTTQARALLKVPFLGLVSIPM